MLYPAIIASFHAFFQEVWMAEKWHKANKSEIHQYYRKLHLYQTLWKYNHAATLLHKAHVDYVGGWHSGRLFQRSHLALEGGGCFLPEIRMARILPLESVKSKELSNIKNAEYTGTYCMHIYRYRCTFIPVRLCLHACKSVCHRSCN